MFRVPNSGDFGLGTEKQRGRRVWSAVGSASRPAGPRPGLATAVLLPSRWVPPPCPERPQPRGSHGPHLPVSGRGTCCALFKTSFRSKH